MPPADKICTIAQLVSRLAAHRESHKRIVQCHGVFDVLHPGHVLHLKEARGFGDILVVTITPDRFVNKGPGRPVFTERLRLETIASLEYVDYVALNEWPTAVEALRQIRPNVYAKGKDYADLSSDVTQKIKDEEHAIKSLGGEIRFTASELFSSSHLANRFFSSYPQQTQDYLAGFKAKYSSDQVIQSLQRLSDLRVLVVGEAILDQYTYCIPLAKSPKEHIVASQFQSEESFAGGALATANHLAGFCKQVTLLTALGKDETQNSFIRSRMRPNVDLKVISVENRPTIVKRRFLEPNFLTKIFELQYLDDTPFPEESTGEVTRILDRIIKDHDFLVAADFGHGLITPPVIDALSASGKFIAVNTQTNSANLGFNPITRYKHVDYACIDEPELRLAARSKYEKLQSVGSRTKRELGARVLMVTWGRNGALMFARDNASHHAPSLAVNIVDRIGAGDAFFAVTSPCVFRDFPSEMVTFVGNCVGALKVAIVCNREPIDPIPLYKFIQHLLK